MSRSWYNLHLHSDHSALDGIIRIPELLKFSEEANFGVGLSDHGTIAGVYELFKEAKALNQSVVPGIEAYVDDIFEEKREDKDRTYYHMCMWALDEEALADLIHMSSASWRYNFYYKPRMNKLMISDRGKNLIASSGCLSGQFSRLIQAGERDKAQQLIEWMIKKFRQVYMEIQAAVPADTEDGRRLLEHQTILNSAAIEFARAYNLDVIATNDSHYLLKSDFDSHDVWCALQSGKTIYDDKRFRFDLIDDHCRTRSEMEQAFETYYPNISPEIVKQSLDTTVEIGERNKVHALKTFTSLTPKLLPDDEAFIRLCELAAEGYKKLITKQSYEKLAVKRGISVKEAERLYKERFSYELQQIKKQGFVDYFLLVHELLDWCEQNGIYRGAARGSAASSLISYLVGITKVIDPLEHDLIFERFIAPDRIYQPDIDLDFAAAQRDQVVQHLVERWGVKNVSMIGTFIKEKGKLVLGDIGRTYKIPGYELQRVKDVVIQRATGDARASETLDETFATFKEAREFNEKYPYVFPMAIRLEGCVRGYGQHAAGVLITPDKLENYIPIEQRKKQMVCAFDGLAVEKMGFLKLDILGIDVLDLLRDIHDMVLERCGVDIDYWTLPLDDKLTLETFAKGDLLGVFQFQKSLGMENVCRAAPMDKFDDIVHLNSLYRPGGMRSGAAQTYLNNRSGRTKIKSVHPIYDEITEPTYGIIIYQEQVMQMFSRLAGFPATRVDEGRKLISKSHGVEAFDRLYPEFKDGCAKNGIDESQAYEFFTKIRHTGSYCFNKCLDENAVLEDGRTIKDWFEKPGKILHSLDEKTGKLVENKVIRVYSTGRKHMIQIGWDGGSLKCTPEHQIWTQNRGWIKAGQLEKGDLLYAETQRISAQTSRTGTAQKTVQEWCCWGQEALGESRAEGPNGIQSRSCQESLLGFADSRGKNSQSQEAHVIQGIQGKDFQKQKKMASRSSRLGCAAYEGNASALPESLGKWSSGVEGASERPRVSQGNGQKDYQAFSRFGGFPELGESGICKVWALVPESFGNFSSQLSSRLRARRGTNDTELPQILRSSFEWSNDRARWDEAGARVLREKISGFRTEAADNNPEGVGAVPVRWIKHAGIGETFDIEMFGPFNSYLANGIVVHNSHAVAYSLLAYYSQYMKAHYPEEFWVCFLNREEDEDLIKSAIRYWTKHYSGFLPLDINRSMYKYSVDEGAIRAGFNKLKWFSPAVWQEVQAKRPFKSHSLIDPDTLEVINYSALDDLQKRISKRLCNARVQKNLLIAGAFDGLLGKETVLDMLEMNERERELASAEIYPSFSGINRMDEYIETVDKLKLDYNLTKISELRGGYNGLFQVAGVISETRFNRVGDFDKEAKSDEEKDRIFKQHGWLWGARFIDLDIDDGNDHVRLRINPDFYDLYGDYFRTGNTVLVRGSYSSRKVKNEDGREFVSGGIGIVTGVELLGNLRDGTPSTPYGHVVAEKGHFLSFPSLKPITDADEWGWYWGVIIGWSCFLKKGTNERYAVVNFQCGNKLQKAVMWAKDYARLGEKLTYESLVKVKVRYNSDTAFFDSHLSMTDIKSIKVKVKEVA